jgi:hypothetical protein
LELENGRLGPASWQRPTADTDTLVNENNEIIELLMDMEIKLIDHSCYKLFFDTLLRGRATGIRVRTPEGALSRVLVESADSNVTALGAGKLYFKSIHSLSWFSYKYYNTVQKPQDNWTQSAVSRESLLWS